MELSQGKSRVCDVQSAITLGSVSPQSGPFTDDAGKSALALRGER